MSKYIAEERWVADGRVLARVEFHTRDDALDFWSRRLGAAVQAGTYAPGAPRRLVLTGPDKAERKAAERAS